MRTRPALFAALLSLSPLACAPAEVADVPAGAEGKADSSLEATILDFEFDAELTGASFWGSEQTIRDQLLYSIGQLNGNRSVGRLDRLVLSNVRTDAGHVTYHAKMPVAWGSKTNLPTAYTFKLPKDVSGFDAFAAKYKDACAESSPHTIDSGSMWYYYRPSQSGCSLDAGDIVTANAKVTVSSVNTDGKYPEYNKVWEDGALNVVAIFGKYEDGATSAGDAGIQAYNTFANAVKTALSQYQLTTVPAVVPSSPGVGVPEITFKGKLAGGRTVQVTALLVDNIGSTTAAFDAHYAELSTRADLIAYNGHAGLGQNVRALAHKGKWVTGQYLVLFMNGCDTYAYVDGSLAQTRAPLNPDDASGTKYLDFVVNAEPSFFASDSSASMAIIKGLLKVDAPLTYQQIFANIDRSQVVLVTGEEDNQYTPGGVTPPGGAWAGIDESGTVAKNVEKRWTTPKLPAGAYTFEISGTGDADLYVRKGEAPTTTSYDCRPYKNGSAETCTVSFTTPSVVNVMVRGYAATSTFRLVGRAQ